MTKPAHILVAERLLREAEERRTQKPTSITTHDDVVAAEQRVAQAEAELRAFEQDTEGMRETLDKHGVKGIVVEQFRFDQIENLRAKVQRRHQELINAKRAWLAGTEE